MLKISSNTMTIATLPLEDDGLLISKVTTGVEDSSKIRVTYSSYNYSNGYIDELAATIFVKYNMSCRTQLKIGWMTIILGRCF